MAQHDYILDNNDGASFRSDLNAALQALLTVNSGSVAPAVTAPQMLWFDTGTGVLRIRNPANTAWLVAVTPDVFAAKQPGDIIQQVHTQSGTSATGTTQIPFDNTIPQITEGNEYMTRAITPTNASNILLIDVSIILSSNFVGTTTITAALFRDSTANALAAGTQLSPAANSPMTVSFRHRMTAGSTAATTFRVRGGTSGAGTTTFNGNAGAGALGGVLASSITITEIKA
jgi:hypothetical protein